MVPIMTQGQRVLIRRIIGVLLIVTAVLEVLWSLIGPLAFNRKPSLILAPIYAPAFDSDEIVKIRGVLEKELAAGSHHAIYPKNLIENFYLERDNAIDVFDGSYRGKDEAFALGNALGVERVAIASFIRYAKHYKLYLTIYDIATDQVVSRLIVGILDMEGLLAWQDVDGESIILEEAMDITVPGLSISAWLFLGWIVIVGLSGLILAFGWVPPRFLIESLFGIGLLLSLFSWIYALNGDMDYVQRFVATSGILQIDDTARERATTLFRFLAPLILLAAASLVDIITRLMDKSKGGLTWQNAVNATAPLWAGLSAILYTLSLPNIVVLQGIPILAWVATAPLYVALRRVHFGRGLYLLLVFVGLQALLINWWQGTFSYISLPFTVVLTLIQYLPFTLLMVFTLRCFPRYGLWAAPFLWTAFDWFRSLGFIGYPWGLLGVSQYGHPALIQIAAFGGVWMVSFLPHLSNAALAWAFEDHEAKTARERLVPLGACAAGILLLVLCGALTIRGRDKVKEGRQVRILITQQNTDPRKHDYQLSFTTLSRLTDEALEKAGPFDLVAWSEGGFPPDIRFWLDEKRSKWRRGRLVRSLLDWQSSRGVPLVTGTQDHFYEPGPPSEDAEAPEKVKRIQNSAVYLPPDRSSDYQRNYYYKMKLVPFTENFPYREEFPWVAELLHNFSTTQWTPGTEHRVLSAPTFKFSTPICFEDVFPNHLRRFVLAGAEVFVNISNDYWANTPLEGYQHGAHAVFRAVENRRPLVRATSSGWTISVDTEGRIATGWPGFYTEGWTVGEHILPEEPSFTFYTRFGDWFPKLCGIIWIVLLTSGGILRWRGGNARQSFWAYQDRR